MKQLPARRGAGSAPARNRRGIRKRALRPWFGHSLSSPYEQTKLTFRKALSPAAVVTACKMQIQLGWN